MKKVFVLTQFGSPHSWTKQYIDHVQKLEKYGWYWKIFTPNELKSKGNVEIIPMTIEGFNGVIARSCGVNPHNFLNPFPVKPVSDFYVGSGEIFAQWLEDADFWGITNWDIVYGRLDRFITDEMLKSCDIFSDDTGTINGIFSLYRNEERINSLYRDIPEWERKFTEHRLFGTDEYDMTEVVNRASDSGRIRFGYPKNYPMHSHDRLEQHVPAPKLEIKEDGSLWEKFKDINYPNWIHARPFIGREIPYFHFIRTKEWPKSLS